MRNITKKITVIELKLAIYDRIEETIDNMYIDVPKQFMETGKQLAEYITEDLKYQGYRPDTYVVCKITMEGEHEQICTLSWPEFMHAAYIKDVVDEKIS